MFHNLKNGVVLDEQMENDDNLNQDKNAKWQCKICKYVN